MGASVIEVLRENGAKVVTTARSIPRNSLAGVHYVAANITMAEGCTLVAQSALDHLGGIDIVVNVLGGSEAPAGGFAALDDEEWRKEIDLNLMPAVRLDRTLLPSMLAQGSGVIVHVTSIQHELPPSGVDHGVCGGEGRPVDVQQGTVEGSDAKGNPRGACLAGLGGDRGGRGACRASRRRGKDRLRGRQADPS